MWTLPPGKRIGNAEITLHHLILKLLGGSSKKGWHSGWRKENRKSGSLGKQLAVYGNGVLKNRIVAI
jgi:hypothetical protein